MPAEDRTQISIRVPVDVVADFERIARALDRDRTWVMLRAFRSYLDGEGGHLLEELEGMEQLDAGKAADFDEALDKADAIISAARSARQARGSADAPISGENVRSGASAISRRNCLYCGA